MILHDLLIDDRAAGLVVQPTGAVFLFRLVNLTLDVMDQTSEDHTAFFDKLRNKLYFVDDIPRLFEIVVLQLGREVHLCGHVGVVVQRFLCPVLLHGSPERFWCWSTPRGKRSCGIGHGGSERGFFLVWWGLGWFVAGMT
jgi:hypothetical protein